MERESVRMISTAKRWIWFVYLWAAGVVSLGLLGMAIRLIIRS